MQFTAEVTPMAMELIFDKSIRDPEAVEISIPVYRARRHHKKKRIRKKWIKRYGVTIEYETYRGKFTENEDGSYGFKGRRVWERNNGGYSHSDTDSSMRDATSR